MNADKTWSQHIVEYYENLQVPVLPAGYSCLNTYQSIETKAILHQFASKYLSDQNERTLIFGINPGRFGAGITGISFTDPIRLESSLGIANSFAKRSELSSQFIYKVIDTFGGVQLFYSHFFMSALFPMALLHNGKNINYYEIPNWKTLLQVRIEKEIDKHLLWNVNRKRCICIGMGENFKFMKELNQRNRWFQNIEVLPHPRWIMQYRRKELDLMVELYVRVLGIAI